MPAIYYGRLVTYVRSLLSLGEALDRATTSAVDVGDIQRAAIVMVVSALDHFVHEKVREGMFEALEGTRARTSAFDSFEVAMSLVLQVKGDPANDDWLDDAITKRHGHRPFLKTEDIAGAIRLTSEVQLWNEVANHLGYDSAQTLKTDIKLIVDRRNKIAHEADLDPTQPGSRWPISHDLASDAVDLVESVVRGIEACA